MEGDNEFSDDDAIREDDEDNEISDLEDPDDEGKREIVEIGLVAAEILRIVSNTYRLIFLNK